MEGFLIKNGDRIYKYSVCNYADLVSCLKQLKKWFIRSHASSWDYDADWCISIPQFQMYIRYSIDENKFGFNWLEYNIVFPTQFWATYKNVCSVVFNN